MTENSDAQGAVDLTDREALKDWLMGLPHRAQITFAARAALRSLPAAMAVLDQKVERFASDEFLLACFRATIVSGVACTWPTPETSSEIFDAASDASFFSAADDAASDAFSAAAAAASAASFSASFSSFSAATFSSFSFASAAFSASFSSFSSASAADVLSAYSEETRDLFATWLWPDHTPPDQIDQLWQAFANQADGTVWEFWRDWYQGMLDGKPLDWDLQTQIALIPDADWEKGPAHIAAMIEEIKAQFLAKNIPLAEAVEFNEDTSKFHAIPREIAKPDLLGATMSQVGDALDDVLANPSNGLKDTSREARVLRRTASKYGNDPQRIEMDFTAVHAGLTRQIVKEDLPASEENLALQRALAEGAQAIRATHEDVAENRHILETQKIAELTDEQKAQLAEAQLVLAAISEGAMREDFGEDIPFLMEDQFQLRPVLIGEDRNPVLAGYDEKRRVFGRAAQIGMLLREFPEIIYKIDGSAGYKAARIVTTIRALVRMGLSLMGII